MKDDFHLDDNILTCIDGHAVECCEEGERMVDEKAELMRKAKMGEKKLTHGM